LVGVQIGADTITSWRSEHRVRAFVHQGCRMGFAVGTTELAKHFLPRTRPDGSDRKSFWSGHTANAGAAAGWNYSVGIPIEAAVALLRGGAKLHYLTDVGVGAVDGWAAGWVCGKLIPAERGP